MSHTIEEVDERYHIPASDDDWQSLKGEISGQSREAAQHLSGPSRDQGIDIRDDVKALITSQMRDPFHTVKEGLVRSLEQCLNSERRVLTAGALSGYVDHFQTLQDDFGWGCGWRNIQMLCSFLLSEVPEAREVLFDGVGFVPDIPSLQRWLEIAWRKGFDPSGAEYFNWEIYGTKKSIGTTECAALLRLFGVRVMIVSFTAMEDERSEDSGGVRHVPDVGQCGSAKANETTVPKGTQPIQASRHLGICDECGQCFAQGSRYRGLVKKEYDLCSNCITKGKKQLSTSMGTEKGTPILEYLSVGSYHKGKLATDRKLESASRKVKGADRDQCTTEDRLVSEEESYRGVEKHLQRIRKNKDSTGTAKRHMAEGSSQEHPSNGERSPNSVTGDNPEIRHFDSSSRRLQSEEFSAKGTQKGFQTSEGGIRGDSGQWHLSAENCHHHHLIEWVWKYFTGESLHEASSGVRHLQDPILMSDRSPLYFQHRGHSRTIVGVEQRRKQRGFAEQVFLLVFDPSQRTEYLAKTLREKSGWKCLIQHNVNALDQEMYQLCYADRGIARGEELEKLKVLTSLNYSY